MVKLSIDQRDSMMAELLGGETPKALQTKYGISKQAFYTIKSEAGVNVNSRNQKKAPENKQKAEMETPAQINEKMLDPENMKEFVTKTETEEPKPSFKIPKSLLDATKEKVKAKTTKVKEVQKEKIDDEEEDEDEEHKKLVCKIRQYLFAFEDNRYLQEYVGKDGINKFVLGLAKKSNKDLQNILEYVKFHIRNKNADNVFLENSIATFMILVEKIARRVGIDLDGLAQDVSLDLKEPSSDLKRSLTEISIEMDVNRYFNNPKVDLLMGLSQKLLFTHQKNKHLNRLQKHEEMKPPPAPVRNVEHILASGLDESLKEKYQDL